MSKKYEAMVLSCLDPRFQKPVHKFLKEKKLTGKYSAFTIAGGSIGVTNEKFKKGHSTFWENLETSIKLHKINKIDLSREYPFCMAEEYTEIGLPPSIDELIELERNITKAIAKLVENGMDINQTLFTTLKIELIN